MLEYADIQDIHYTDDSTILVLKVDKNLKEKIERQHSSIVELRLGDKRLISPEQRKKAHAMIRDIAIYQYEDEEYLKRIFKNMLRDKYNLKDFSLSNCPMSVAREYITLIIDVCLEYDIPTSVPIIQYSDDIEAYLHLCIKHRRCAITGEPNADIHHLKGSRVGMGANRNKVNHGNRKLIALNREWHTKVHAQGEQKIFTNYKIFGVIPSNEVLKKIGLKSDSVDAFNVGDLVRDNTTKVAGHVIDILGNNKYLLKMYGKSGEYINELELKNIEVIK